MNEIIVRKATVLDINDIVDIHLAAFENFFLTSLGRDFLKYFYHSCVCFEGCSIQVVEERSNEVIQGFILYSYESSGFYSKLIRFNLKQYLVLGLRILVTRPKALYRLFKNLNKGNNKSKIESYYSEILSIAVLPNHRGSGAGQTLIDASILDLRIRDIDKVVLTTDKLDNDAVKAFYKKNRFYVLEEFLTYPNRPMLRLIRDIRK